MSERDTQYDQYFARQIELWGAERQALLRDKHIAIIGCGGLGSALAMALGSSGIGYIDLVDFDTVSLHNIHRQIAFVLDDIGDTKSSVVAKLLKAKNRFVQVEAFEMDFTTFAELDRDYDLILDATDNHGVRREIDSWSKRHETPWIYGSVEAFQGQVCFFDRSTFEMFDNVEHEVAGTTAPMVMHIASMQANMALRYLVGLPIPRDQLHYIYHDNNGAQITQKFAMPIQHH